MKDTDTIIIGAGLAGLSCGLHLQKNGREDFLILEASDDVGGRVRTDAVDGYLLDRGFQVFLTAYPEAKQVLDYNSLNLRAFRAGALVRYNGKFHRVCDPFKEPDRILETLSSPIGSFADKLSVARLRMTCGSMALAGHGGDSSTFDELKRFGFSNQMIEPFFKPFFGGVFLERDLVTSSRNFSFLFGMFASGQTVLPEKGMQEIPRQLACRLGKQKIRLNTPVRAISGQKLALADGQTIEARKIVIATEASAIKRLLDLPVHAEQDRSVTCMYFSANRSPVKEPILVLNGEGEGPVNNLSVLSDVSPAYAAPGKALISVSVIGNPKQSDQALELSVRQQLGSWFGHEVSSWGLLKIYRIDHALPGQAAPFKPSFNSPLVRDGLYVCGDHMSIGSINGAFESGRKTAELMIAN